MIGHYKTERKAELDEAKGMVQSWKASYEGNYLVGENVVDVPRWVCSKSKVMIGTYGLSG